MREHFPLQTMEGSSTMKHRKWSAALVAATMVAVGAVGVGQADASALSSAQVSTVENAAKELGFTDAQARAIARDPKAAATVPVKTELTTTEILKVPGKADVKKVRSEVISSATLSAVAKQTAAKNASPKAAGGPWVNVPGCKEAGSVLKYSNILGVKLFDYSMNKYWCWDMHRVTYAPPATRHVHIYERFVWFFRGDIGSGQFGVQPAGDGFRGDQSWFQGNFEWCGAKYGCLASKQPTVLVTGWFDGQYDTNAWT